MRPTSRIGGSAEVTLVFAVELRGIVATDSVAGFRRVEIFAEHQPPGLLKPQLLLELQTDSSPSRL